MKAFWALGLALLLGLDAVAAAEPHPWRTVPGGRIASVSPSVSGKVGFTLLPPAATGVNFTNQLSDQNAAANQIRLNGSGVALGDVNGDGGCDLYLCGLDGDNALFLNRGGWKFERDTNSPAIACRGQDSTGAVLADVDGDGDLDLLVNGIGVGTRLFLNDGKGGFAERAEAGFFHRGGASSFALADVDGDGDLDVYVCVYRSQTIRSTGLALLNVGGRRMVPPEQRNLLEITAEGRVLEHGEPDILYLNQGGGQFAPVSWIRGAFMDEAGQPLTKVPFDWGLSAQFRDLNGDGRPDLYVCNDFHSPDRFWLNESTSGVARFRAAPMLALRHTPTFSMAVDFADFNRDGHDDFFVPDMLSPRHERRLMRLAASDPSPFTVGVYADRPQYDRNALQLNRGDNTFADVAWFAGLGASDWTWSAVALDVDLDGYEDLLCTTGHAFDTQDLDADARIQAAGPWTQERTPQKLLLYPRQTQPNVAFRNATARHAGAPRFEDVSAEWGFDLDGVSHGMALADLDNDGDLDVVVNNLNAPATLYRNDAPAPRLAVRLRGAGGNTHGIGARITVLGGAVPRQAQEMIAGGRYASGDDSERVFAAGPAVTLDVEVRWPSGKASRLAGVPANSVVEVAEAGAGPAEKPVVPAAAPALFAEASPPLPHTNHTAAFDDFARQPLLPYRLSTLGPGVTWTDPDGDGRDELVLPDGAGGTLAVFRFATNGSVQRIANRATAADQTAVLPLGTRLLVGQSNYRDGSTNPAAVSTVDAPGAPPATVLSGVADAVGALALADVDGDGRLDLFVGGRSLPGRWPEPASSRLLRGGGTHFVLHQSFPQLGLVTGATFTDLDGNGSADLAVATEWGPLKLFRNERGRLTAWDPALVGAGVTNRPFHLSDLTGRWTGIVAGDFDGDGRMDLVAGNRGENLPHVREEPRLYYGDFEHKGTVDLVEAVFDPALKQVVPTRPLNALEAGLPSLRDRFPTFAAFNRATVAEVLGAAAGDAKELRARCPASVLLLNRGDRFEVRPLPAEAQYAPVFGLAVADFNGDGREDLFLAQNFFGVEPLSARLDAGLGLVLLGDGQGGFRPLSASESGIRIWGEGRGAAVADFDADGRPDLCVAQSGAETRLFHNVSGQPGLRVRLRGPAGNPSAIGASLRLVHDGRAGPRRELHAGAGHWSCDSATTVLGGAPGDGELEVRWPGGRVTKHPVAAGTKELNLTLP